MALNFNYCNSISSVGSGVGNETIDDPFFVSPTDTNVGFTHVRNGGQIHSNFGLGQVGLISHRVTQVMRTYVSPSRVQVHGIVDSAPLQNRHALSLSEVTTVTEVVKTTHFLTSTSIMERMFASRTIVSNQEIFPTHGVVTARNQPNQDMNFLLSQNKSMNEDALCILNHSNHVNGQRETVFDPTSAYSYQHPSSNQGLCFDQATVILPNLDNPNKSNYNMNQESGPSYDNRIACYDGSNQEKEPSPQTIQPRLDNTFEEVSDENDNDYSLGNDGRTHSLPNYPEGVYVCPKCFVAFRTSQKFAAHIQTHYKRESKEQRKKRMAAKCRRKNLNLMQSPHGLTAMPKPSSRIAKRYIVKRKNDVAVNVENEEEVHQRLGLSTSPATAKNGPLDVVMVKEEPILLPD